MLRVPSLSRLTIAVAAFAALAGIAYLAYGVWARPYTEIEAQIVFQVARVQQHLPLYTDPAIGAWELGAPPSRFNVLYPPLWVELLARVPARTLVGIRTVARALSVALVLYSLVSIARGARPENRRLVVIGALLTLGHQMIMRGAGLAATDVPAVALSIAGLVRANRKGRLDVPAAVLLALAPFVKHAVIGVSIGAFAAHVVSGPRRGGARAYVLPLVTGALTSAALVAHYHRLSEGAWLEHILRATGQPLSFGRWVQEFLARFALLGLPHAVVLVVAIRRRAPPLAVFPFAMSLAWTALTLAKLGSTTHYWLEPTLACLVTLGALPPAPSRSPALERLSLALAVAVAVTSLPAFARAPGEWATWRPLMNEVRSACALGSGQVAMAADVRVEVELDGRVITPAWESSQMARAGRFSLAGWRRDLQRPEVGCLVTEGSYFDPPPDRLAPDVINAYRAELRDVVASEFEAPSRTGPFLVWRRRALQAANR